MSRAEDLFKRALSVPPEERGAFLEEAAGDDGALRDEVRSLLAHGDDAPGRFLEGRAVELASFGPYEVEEQIGYGGQGSVFRANDSRLGRKVALKVLNPAMALSQDALARFQREAEATARLDHPGICSVYETGQVEGSPYIAMQYVEGPTLQKLITDAREDPAAARRHIVRLPDDGDEGSQDGSVSSARTYARHSPGMRAVHVVEQIARALHAAHEAGVVHRDVKPGNIMVAPDGSPVVLDFGLARDLQGSGPTLTRAGDIFGTPSYMSPEQITRSAIKLDRRTDIYSLGCVLYECLTLKLPLETESVESLYQAILTREPQNPRKINSTVPNDVRVILETAMNKDRDRRYATAENFADDLLAVLEYRPIRARPVSPVGRAVRWVQRQPMKAALLAVLAIGLPLVTWLGGNVVAHKTAIDVGRAAERQRLEYHHFDVGFIQVSANDYDGARPHFERCLELNSRSLLGLLSLWWIEHHRQTGLELVQSYSAELKDDPGYRPLLGVALVAAGREREGLPALDAKHWLAHYMVGGGVWLEGAKTYREDRLAMGAYELELSHLMAPVRLFGALVKIAESLAQTRDPHFKVIDRVIADLYPDEAQAWAYRAKCRTWRGELETARELREGAAELIGEGTDFRHAYLLRLDTAMALAEGDIKKAIAVGEDAWEARRVAYTGVTLARAYLGAGLIDKARNLLLKVEELATGPAPAKSLLALCDEREGDYTSALKHVDDLAALPGLLPFEKPFDHALVHKARILLDGLKDVDAAKEAVDEAIKRWPGNPIKPGRPWSRYMKVRVQLAKGELADAREAFKALEADPRTRITARRMYDDGMSHEGVLCALRAGVELFPQEAARQDALAQFYLDSRHLQANVAGALEPARFAAQLDKRYRLTEAKALFRNDKHGQAIALAQAVIRDEPQNAEAARVLARFLAVR